jgi:hypothetical protein
MRFNVLMMTVLAATAGWAADKAKPPKGYLVAEIEVTDMEAMPPKPGR